VNCSRCGFPLGNQQGYCPRCGTAFLLTGVNVPPVGNSSADRLWKARVGVGVVCLILGMVLFASLESVAGGLAVVALIIFAAGWSMPTITYQRKIVFIIVSLVLIVGAESVEISIAREHGAVRQQHFAQIEAQKEAESREAAQQAENAFKNMTPAQHLSAAQSDLHVGASEDQVLDGMKHLDALNGTPTEGRAKALRARYEAEKTKADKAAAAAEATAAARQEKEDSESKEVAREAYAKTLESNLLDEDMEADVKALGPHHTTLEMTWALASKVFVHKISESEEFQQHFQDMRALGFKKFVVTNGLETDEHTWTWNLGQ